ncbi:MAG: transposase [Candidatus Omnitrophica bacterium]|nr:transposase [Candidatus Omnitrophota bacterium]
MPRPLRVHMEGALYYVTCRAEPGIPLFQDARDAETYLDLLSQYKNQQGVRVYAFSLCAYELHLLLEVGGSSTISQFMHALNSRYTKLYCKRYIHAGHLFQGRFRAVVAEKASCLFPLVRFVHSQPGSLAGSLPRYESRETAGWMDLPEAGSESWSMEPAGPAWDELRRSLQKPAMGSAAFLEEVKRRVSAVPAPKAAGPEEEDLKELEEEEEELVPVRIRKGWHRNGFLAVAVMAALAGMLSQRALAPAPSESKVHVIVESQQSAEPASQMSVAGAQMASLAPTPRLGGTTWDIQIRPSINAAKSPIREDSIRFDANRVASTQLSAEGFSPSNYTLTPQPDGTFIWETMQSGPGGEVVCWRGECDGQRMRGVMTRQKDGTETESFNFIAVNPMSEA